MLSKILNKCKDWLKENGNDLIIAVVIIAVALIGFGLGRLSRLAERKTPIRIEYFATSSQEAAVSGSINSERQNPAAAIQGQSEKIFVASKNGKNYHYPWCSGAQRIKEENKIWFPSREEAESKGYTPAANCKGL